jgi:thiol-disulfide isomerase/thioredoxin
MKTDLTRRRWLYGGVAAVAAGAGVGGAWMKRDAIPTRVSGSIDIGDSTFWARTFMRPDGGELSLANLRGKPLLVNFWATWCPPCIEELPMIDRFFRDQAASGWQVIGLAIDQPSSVRKFLEKTPVSFPVGMAGLEGTELVRQLGNTGGGLPFTLAIQADGKVAASKMGKLEAADLEAWRRAQVHG